MRQSKRRMAVAQRRAQHREDVLQRRPVSYRYPRRRPVIRFDGCDPRDVVDLVDRLLEDDTGH